MMDPFEHLMYQPHKEKQKSVKAESQQTGQEIVEKPDPTGEKPEPIVEKPEPIGEKQDPVAEIQSAEVSVTSRFEKFEEIIIGSEEGTDKGERKELETIRLLAQAAKDGVLEKISSQLGSNEGGWYEDKETGEKHYVKFYKNPDQARVEFVANAIYEKLGINSVRSQLFEMNGKLAIGSKGIEGGGSATKQDMRASADVQNGFIADAFLANWDVVGLVYDNVVKDVSGNMHRIDNGGSIIFRAQGGAKGFSSDSIPELDSMRNPDFTSGQVFSDITENQMAEQARKLADTLSDDVIDQILAQSGLEGSALEKVRQGLVGRREYLKERFQLRAKETKEAEASKHNRIGEALDRLREMRESKNRVEGLRNRVGILADGDKIEGQQINIIDATDEGRYDINFKLTAKHYLKILDKFKDLFLKGEAKEGDIEYGSGMIRCIVSKALEIQTGDITLKVSTGRYESIDRVFDPGNTLLSTLGLIQIEVRNGNMTPEAINDSIKNIIENILEVQAGLEAPKQGDEDAYRKARYAWKNKLNGVNDITPEERRYIELHVTREEVFPGYQTFVEKGRSQELREKYGDFVIFHDTKSIDLIPSIIKAGGLLSTHERNRRGLLAGGGMSSDEDMRTGGADSVFTRIMSEQNLKRPFGQTTFGETAVSFIGARFVFDQTLMDRTDFYAYDSDQYGSTSPGIFVTRQTPNEMFEEGKKYGLRSNNEQMFRLGIPVDKMKAIVVKGEALRIEIIKSLKDNGIEEINGKPVEDFVVIVKKEFDVIDVANGKPLGSSRKILPPPLPEID